MPILKAVPKVSARLPLSQNVGRQEIRSLAPSVGILDNSGGCCHDAQHEGNVAAERAASVR
jgi:hypothetical protein